MMRPDEAAGCMVLVLAAFVVGWFLVVVWLVGVAVAGWLL